MADGDEQVGSLRDKASEVENARDTANSLLEELARQTQILVQHSALPGTGEIAGIVAEALRQARNASEILGSVAGELRTRVEQAEEVERGRRRGDDDE